MVLISIASTGLSLYQPYLSKTLVDKALIGHDWNALLRVTATFALITVISFVLNVTSGLRYTRVSADILFDMRLALYRHLQRLSPRFYARTRLGDIVSRINNDIGEIQRIAAETALSSLGNLLSLVGTIALLLWLDWKLFLLSVALLPLSLWALHHYRARLEAKVATLRQASADIGSFLIETLQGMKLVVASNAQEREITRFQARNNAFIDALMSMQLLSYFSGGLPNLILTGSTMAVFLYGGYQVIQGQMTLGAFVAFIAYQMRLMPPIQALMALYANLATAKVSLQRVRQLLDAPVEIQESPTAQPLAHVLGRISFDQVSFRFDRNAPVLERLSFEANPGETIAIVGPSGSGKSTIADLLLRMLDPDEGTVQLDGHDLRTLRLADLRRHVALVNQEPYVFHASIAENLRYVAPQATDAQLQQAAQAAGIADFIDALPLRYDTVVGERGTALSGGERQRLAIARAFLADPAVLILDEPTAALDPLSEQKVIEGYEQLRKGRTTIVISHRFEPARRADRVVVLGDVLNEEAAAHSSHR